MVSNLTTTTDEIDSYLYQTVGQDAIQLVADALEVPLIRKIITGVAVEQGSEYGSRLALEQHGVNGDETEDLFQLLSEVKTKFPDVRGVSVGAILSNYQRVRVEHVCQRLSLTPLCYLWQRDQSELLMEMISSGLEAILIKVAGIGLTTKHLGKTLVEMQPILMKLNTMYGAHVCGEGGEYESLTLDSPLFKHRIVLEDVETVIHSDNAFATVAFLKVKRAYLERKPVSMPTLIEIPPILDDVDQHIKQAVLCSVLNSQHTPPAAPYLYNYWKNASAVPCSRKVGPWIVISNVQAMYATSIEDEVRACFECVKDHLAERSLNLSNIANITLVISSMELFPVVNAIYTTFFGSSPPARACVAADLPASVHIQLECVAHIESRPGDRQSLHVQSLSYWAPANIGPYSQAISVEGRIFVSGQIGLVPSNNTLPSPQSLPQEVALSTRHVRSVSNVVKHSSTSCWDGVTQAVIVWLARVEDLVPVRRGIMASEMLCQGTAPTLFVTVKALPKNALVETQVLLHTARRLPPDENHDEPNKSVAKFISGQLPGLQVHWEVSYFEDMDYFVAVVACMSHDDESIIAGQLASITVFQRVVKNTLFIRLFHTPTSAPDVPRLLHPFFSSNDAIPPVTAISSRSIATWALEGWDYSLCFVG